MPNLDPSLLSCRVYAFKEGLLAAVGHDVALSVGKISMSLDGDRIQAIFDAGSLSVLHAMRGGAPHEGALSDKDKRTIEGYVREDILHSRRYPAIRFTSTSIARDDDSPDTFVVEGTLELHGRTKTIRVPLAQKGDQIVARAKLHQPDFGITPFRAMLGALRIQPHVEVEIAAPLEVVRSLLPSA